MQETSKPKVSIVIPTYNRKDFTRRCIDKAFDQGYANLEVIVGDGASKDGTVEMLQELSAGEPRLKFFSEPDDGECDAINHAFQIVTGDIVSYIPSDDYFVNNAVRVAVETLESQPDLDGVGGDVLYVDPEGRELGYGMTAYRGTMDKARLKWILMTRSHPPLFSQCFFFRKKCLSHGGVNPEFKYAHDYEFQIRMIASGCKFRAIPNVLGHYTLHPQMASQQHLKTQMAQCNQICRMHGLGTLEVLFRCTLGRIINYVTNRHRSGIAKGVASELPRVIAEFRSMILKRK